jgi:hypothetical protein
MKQGEVVEPSDKDNVMEHFVGHTKQKERSHELDPEYRPNFDRHLFATFMQYMKFIQQQQQEMIADRLAMNIIRNKDAGISDEVEPNGPRVGNPVGPNRVPGMGVPPNRVGQPPIVSPGRTQPIR